MTMPCDPCGFLACFRATPEDHFKYSLFSMETSPVMSYSTINPVKPSLTGSPRDYVALL